MSLVLSFKRAPRFLALLGLGLLASSCARMSRMSDEECMTRVMYFESNRSSEEGMLAVGTVVMNRLKSGKYPKTVCGVVGQKNQFAPGVLSKRMEKGRDLAARTAKKVLRGEKHREVGTAMFFHTAGYSFPYTNMHYVTIQGGNAFYEKRKDATVTQEEVARRQARLTYEPPQRGILSRTADALDPRRPLPPSVEARLRPPAPAVLEGDPDLVWVPVEPSATTEPQPRYGRSVAEPRYDIPAAAPLEPMDIDEIIERGG